MPLFNPSGPTLEKTAFVELAANGGNDTAGQVGNPARPFATGTAAMVALKATGGASFHLHFGIGNHAEVVIAGGGLLSISGQGHYLTIVQGFRFVVTGEGAAGTSGVLQDVGFQSVYIQGNISCDGTGGGPTNNQGGSGGQLTLIGVKANAIVTAVGGDGWTSTEGFAGGTGGFIECQNCAIAGILRVNGGNGGEGTAGNGGNAGAGGNIVMLNVDGRHEGNPSLDLELKAGAEGIGTDSNGVGESGGFLTCDYSSFNSADFQGGLSNGAATGLRFSRYGSLNNDAGGGEVLANIVSGNFVP